MDAETQRLFRLARQKKESGWAVGKKRKAAEIEDAAHGEDSGTIVGPLSTASEAAHPPPPKKSKGLADAIPEGFFDDRKMDIAARGLASEHEAALDAALNELQQELRVVEHVQQEHVAEADAARHEGRQDDELEVVDALRATAAELHSRVAAALASGALGAGNVERKSGLENDDDSDSDSDDDDGGDPLAAVGDWRARGAR
eukprot:Amastigsp_a340083_59.p2 type:complete len:201 gc:universal Amastigsp_a340083_59:775-173(-)